MKTKSITFLYLKTFKNPSTRLRLCTEKSFQLMCYTLKMISFSGSLQTVFTTSRVQVTQSVHGV